MRPIPLLEYIIGVLPRVHHWGPRYTSSISPPLYTICELPSRQKDLPRVRRVSSKFSYMACLFSALFHGSAGGSNVCSSLTIRSHMSWRYLSSYLVGLGGEVCDIAHCITQSGRSGYRERKSTNRGTHLVKPGRPIQMTKGLLI